MGVNCFISLILSKNGFAEPKDFAFGPYLRNDSYSHKRLIKITNNFGLTIGYFLAEKNNEPHENSNLKYLKKVL